MKIGLEPVCKIAEAPHFPLLTCSSGNHLRQPCNHNSIMLPEGIVQSPLHSKNTRRKILSPEKNVLNAQASHNFKGFIPIDFS